MKARFAMALVCLMLGSAVAAFGQTKGTGLELPGVELPKGAAISVVVNSLTEAAIKAGLNDNSVQARVELQLRRNGINVQKESDGFISVSINVVGSAFWIQTKFHRIVTYEVNGQEFHTCAATYDKGIIGTFGSDSEFIMQSVLNHIDILSNEILKAAQ